MGKDALSKIDDLIKFVEWSSKEYDLQPADSWEAKEQTLEQTLDPITTDLLTIRPDLASLCEMQRIAFLNDAFTFWLPFVHTEFAILRMLIDGNKSAWPIRNTPQYAQLFAAVQTATAGIMPEAVLHPIMEFT